MKNILFIILALLTSISAKSQGNVNSNIINISLPLGMEKLTKEEFFDYAKNNFHYSYVTPDNNDFYRNGKMLIAFKDLKGSAGHTKDLPALKAELIEVLGLNTNLVVNESKIITLNNIPILFIQYEVGNDGYITFYTENKNYRRITGIIIYKKADAGKAKQLFQSIVEKAKLKI